MISEKKGIRSALIVAGVALGIAIPLISWYRDKVSEELTKAELLAIANTVGYYIDGYGTYPNDLSYIEEDPLAKQKLQRSRQYFKSESYLSIKQPWEKWHAGLLDDFFTPSIELSQIEYIRPTSKRVYNWNVAHTPTPEVLAAMWNLYGEFQLYGVGNVGKYFWEPIEGLPCAGIIVLIYREDSDGEKTHAITFGHDCLSSREKIDEKLALQNAFLRRPVDRADSDFLLKGLEHDNTGFRFRSAEALAKHDRPEGREFLDGMFLSDDIYLKVRAADALARVGETAAIDYLQGPAQEADDKYIRVFAEITLREIGHWQPTETQFYTDEKWDKSNIMVWIPLPEFREDIEKMQRQDVRRNRLDYLKSLREAPFPEKDWDLALQILENKENQGYRNRRLKSQENRKRRSEYLKRTKKK